MKNARKRNNFIFANLSTVHFVLILYVSQKNMIRRQTFFQTHYNRAFGLNSGTFSEE
jgi:hypothetical protein